MIFAVFTNGVMWDKKTSYISTNALSGVEIVMITNVWTCGQKPKWSPGLYVDISGFTTVYFASDALVLEQCP